MNADRRRRWLGSALGATLMLGACSSNTTNASSPDETAEPSELALEAAEASTAEPLTTTQQPLIPDVLAVDRLTPETFEALKTDEASRAAVVEAMQGQGLGADEAECFLDNVTPELFITFSSGEQPDDAQFSELLGLIDICQIAFGAES